jgi:hypothetical protein
MILLARLKFCWRILNFLARFLRASKWLAIAKWVPENSVTRHNSYVLQGVVYVWPQPTTPKMGELRSRLLPMQLTPFLILSHSSWVNCGIESKTESIAWAEAENKAPWGRAMRELWLFLLKDFDILNEKHCLGNLKLKWHSVK